MMDAEFYRQACARLRKENEDLQNQVFDLREALSAIRNEDSQISFRLSACFGLTRQSGKLLAALMRICPQPASRECLTVACVNSKSAEGHKTVDVHMVRIRKLMKSIGQPGCVKTIWGFGYCLSAEAREAIVDKLAEFEAPQTRVNLCETQLVRVGQALEKQIA